MTTDTAERLAKLIGEITGNSAEEIVPDHVFIDDLAFDSLDILELTIDVEEEFNIDISDNEMAAATTVALAIELIDRVRGSS